MTVSEAPSINSLIYEIQRSTDAFQMLTESINCGLPDIGEWVSVDKLQYYLNNENFVCFVAKKISVQNPTNAINQTIGLIVFGFEEEGRIWIELLGVNDLYKRKGIATRLMNAILEWIKENDIKVRAIFVDVDDDNFDAQKFYKNLKFTKCGKISKYYYDGSDAIIFRKDIN